MANILFYFAFISGETLAELYSSIKIDQNRSRDWGAI